MRALLVAMPFGRIDRPSIALGLLKAALARDGIDCDVAYLNLAFAGRLGAQPYDRVAGARQRALAGDWVFAGCLNDGGPPAADDYVDQVLRAEWRLDEDDIEAILVARAIAPQMLEDALSDLRWADYDLVGFTCSYGQTVPSLALARLVKQTYPHVFTVFGGPTWHDVMGRALFASFPFVDAACLGEGDASFPALAGGLAEGSLESTHHIPGMLVRDRQGDVHDGGPDHPVDDLDELPVPDYTDYSTALAGLRDPPDGAVVIPVETSRGCWWSVRGPCRFCGIVGPHRTWRTKSAGRILQELRTLAAHPGCRLIEVVDNVAAPALLADVLPRLALDPLPARLDVDIRPEVSRHTIELLAETRTDVLTGIESLSERLLVLMNKGTHALDNARFLKWCKARGVQVRWNLLHDFPGETAADYEELMAVLRAIAHLDAPVACATVDVERFSSYFEDPRAYGFANVRPASAYSYLFPFDDDTVRDIAYFFDHEFAQGFEPSGGSFHLRHLVYHWQRAPAQRELRVGQGGGVVIDTRRPEDKQTHRLDELERTLYLACDDIRSRTELEEDVRRSRIDSDGLEARIDDALQRFVEHGLMLRRDDLYLSLALPEAAPPREIPTTAESGTGRARP